MERRRREEIKQRGISDLPEKEEESSKHHAEGIVYPKVLAKKP
jgi:hypothetical protein